MKSYGVIHWLRGARTACGQLFNRVTMIGTNTRDYDVSCRRCRETRAFNAVLGGNVELKPILPNECPCQRTGKGCTFYSAIHYGKPTYTCRFTGKAAYVPCHDGDGGDYQIHGLMMD